MKGQQRNGASVSARNDVKAIPSHLMSPVSGLGRYLEDFVGNTPLVRLKRMPGATRNVVLGGGLWVALEVSREVENAVIVCIVCDRGDRYLSTGVFPA